MKKKPFKIFWGGEDVTPSIYKHRKSAYCGHTNINRDTKELYDMQYCFENDIVIIGICRGAQLANVFNEGTLVQHIEGHAISNEHDIWLTLPDNTQEKLTCTSTHHQMMVPSSEGIVVGYGPSAKGISSTGGDIVEKTYTRVPEIVVYPNKKTICVQPHPEYRDDTHPFNISLNNIIKHYFNLDPISFKEERYK